MPAPEAAPAPDPDEAELPEFDPSFEAALDEGVFEASTAFVNDASTAPDGEPAASGPAPSTPPNAPSPSAAETAFCSATSCWSTGPTLREGPSDETTLSFAASSVDANASPKGTSEGTGGSYNKPGMVETYPATPPTSSVNENSASAVIDAGTPACQRKRRARRAGRFMPENVGVGLGLGSGLALRAVEGLAAPEASPPPASSPAVLLSPQDEAAAPSIRSAASLSPRAVLRSSSISHPLRLFPVTVSKAPKPTRLYAMFGQPCCRSASYAAIATELLKFKLLIPSRIGMRTQAEANRCITASSSPRLSRPNTR